MICEFKTGGLTAEDIYTFLTKCDKQFIPFLSSSINLREYSDKLFRKSTVMYVKQKTDIIGIVAFYDNKKSQGYAFISLICVLKKYERNGIGIKLMDECIRYVSKKEFRSIKLEVDIENENAISFYKKLGYIVEEQTTHSFKMIKQLF